MTPWALSSKEDSSDEQRNSFVVTILKNGAFSSVLVKADNWAFAQRIVDLENPGAIVIAVWRHD
jgi:hypothetical protein